VGAVLSVCNNSSVARFAARNRILEEQLPQVRYIAQKIHARLPRHIELEDLIQTGVLGLMEALRKYDPTRRIELASFARHRIQGAILDSLREQDWSPRLLRRKARRTEQARQELTARMGREPSHSELADALGINIEAWHRMRTDLQLLEVISLDTLLRPENHLKASCLPKARGEDPFEICTRLEWEDLLHEALAALPARKKQALALYYAEGLTMKQVGARLGVCESRVSQMHSAALASLRLRMKELLRSGLPSRPKHAAGQTNFRYAAAEPDAERKRLARKGFVELRQFPRAPRRDSLGVHRGAPAQLQWKLPLVQPAALSAP
jgi:RNA polymerase sigma factor FliA